MIDIWEYANKKPRVMIKTKTGEQYSGKVLTILDAVETEDTDDSMTIRLDSGEIKDFYPDEIESIEVLDDEGK